MKKLLYIVGHDILERNHIELFTELGFEVLSTGKYLYPDKLPPNHEHLPPLKIPYDRGLRDEFLALNPSGFTYGQNKLNLTKEFIGKFDVVFTSWIIEPIQEYLTELLDNGLVVYETLGQSDPVRESNLASLRIQGVKVVRMPAGEENFRNYCGADAFIDLDIDTNYYSGWKGNEPSVLTINSAVTARAAACNTQYYLDATADLPRKLYGSHNDDIKDWPFVYGKATRDELLRQYQRNQVYFSLGTKPCPIVLSFKEAMSVGVPTVTWGKVLGGPTFRAYTHIENGVNGFYSDSPKELNYYIKVLLGDEDLRKSISQKARDTALANFSRSVIREKWREFFKESGVL